MCPMGRHFYLWLSVFNFPIHNSLQIIGYCFFQRRAVALQPFFQIMLFLLGHPEAVNVIILFWIILNIYQHITHYSFLPYRSLHSISACQMVLAATCSDFSSSDKCTASVISYCINYIKIARKFIHSIIKIFSIFMGYYKNHITLLPQYSFLTNNILPLPYPQP